MKSTLITQKFLSIVQEDEASTLEHTLMYESVKISDLNGLLERCGQDHVTKRLEIQTNHIADVLGHGHRSLYFGVLDLALKTLGWFLKCCGLWKRGYRNAMTPRIVYNEVSIAGLPESFENLRILHISDLHLDVATGFGTLLGEAISNVNFDLAVFTGDFRYKTHGEYYSTFRELECLMKFINCRYGCFATLGNHDFLEFVPALEKRGIRILLNEATSIILNGDRLWLVGLDDSHLYRLQDYAKAFREVPTDEFKILMTHSLETLEEAALYQPNYILSGHTHGGQICCIPEQLPLWVNSNCGRAYFKGKWSIDGMSGYTSVGAGSAGLPIRLNCPAEIMIHTFHGLSADRLSDKGPLQTAQM